MKKTNRNEIPYIMTAEVYEQIRNTIGVRRPENGGILGASDGVHIDHYYFDATADRSSVTYTMDHHALNKVIHEWNDNDILLVGIIHSHPDGCTAPSHGDMLTASRIIETMDVKGRFFTPIVQVSPKLNGDIDIYPYTFEQTVELKKQAFEVESPRAKEEDNRFELSSDQTGLRRDLPPSGRSLSRSVRLRNGLRRGLLRVWNGQCAGARSLSPSGRRIAA